MGKLPESILNFEKEDISYIYHILCPYSFKCMYVGQSIDPYNRFQQHKHRSLTEKSKYTKKEYWIRGLKKSPVLKIVGSYPVESISVEEQKEIYAQKILNPKLKNGDEGKYLAKVNSTNQKKKDLIDGGSLGIKLKRNLWEVYLNYQNKRFFCGAYESQVVAQKVYDSVSRNYLGYKSPTKFKGISKISIEKAQQLSKKLASKRNNTTQFPGIHYNKSTKKYTVNIKVDNIWVELGWTKDLEEAIQTRDAVASHLNITPYKYDLASMAIDEAKKKLDTKVVSYNGVSYRATDGQYSVTVSIEGKNKAIGLFRDLDKAVYYCDAVKNYLGQDSNDTTGDKLSPNEANYASNYLKKGQHPGITDRGTSCYFKVSFKDDEGKKIVYRGPAMKDKELCLYYSIALRNYYNLTTDSKITQDKLSIQEIKELLQ